MIYTYKKRSCLCLFRVVFDMIFLLVGLSLPVLAQYQFDVWTTDSGLPQNSVNAILQTRDGYLWLTTMDGLVRFDGVRFTVFNRGNTPGIASNRFTALYEDSQGALWVGTDEEWLTRYTDGVFTSYSITDGQPHGDIRRIVADEQGYLWITTYRGLVRWKNGQYVHFPTSGFSLAPRGDANVWWRLTQAGLEYLEKGKPVTLTRQDGLPNLQVVKVFADQMEDLWIRLADHSLIKVNAGKLTIYAVKEGWPTGGKPFTDRDGNLWLWDNESLRTRAPDGMLQSYPWMPNNLAATVYVDREGSFWFGSGERGLMHARRQMITALSAPPKVHLSTAAHRIQGLNSNLIYTIFQERSGAIWIGSGGGGPIRYQAGRFTHYFIEDGLFGTNVTAIAEDRAGTIWIGTTAGVSRYQNGTLTRFSNEPGLQEVWAMHEDRAGNFWFTTNTGLRKYKDGNFTVYTTRDGLPSNRAGPILETRDGTLWFGTQNSLTRLSDGRFTAYTEKDGLHVGQVRTLYEDSDGVLWIGTYESGLYRFQHGRFTRYTTREGLYNNGVFQILEDARGNFWMSCNLGLYRVRKEELNAFAAGTVRAITSIAYGKQDGMPSLECNGGRQPAGWKMRDGKLWFPTMGGIAIVDPEAVPQNTVPPPVMIEEFLFDQQPQEFQQGVRLAHQQDHFEIRYTGLSYIKPEQVRFKYRLEGLDMKWIEAGTRRTVYYPYVPPGEYLFKVMAANSDGVWNEQAASLLITVQPHWWQTWWFKIGGWLSLLGVIAGLYLRRHAQVKRKQVAQEKVARQLIEAHESERKRIASELHDSLNQTLLIINNQALLGELASHDHEASRTKFSAITESASQAITEINEIIYSLRPSQLDHFGLYKALLTLLEKVEASSGVRFFTEVAELKGVLTPDEETQVYRIVQEGINNIIKHAQATEARLKLVRESQHIFLTLADNGRGFSIADGGLQNADYEDQKVSPPSNPKSEIRNPRSRGFGLTGIRERVRILGGKVEMQTAPGQGTTIAIHFPLTHRGSST